MNLKSFFLAAFAIFLTSCSGISSNKSSQSNGETDLTAFTTSNGVLSPSFSNEVNSYSVDLKNRFDEISFDITPISGATFTVNGTSLQSNYPLAVDQNVFNIVVSSEDSSVQRNIILNINRARQFVYVSNVNTSSPNDTLSLYSINPSNGQLEPLTPSNQVVGNDPYDLLVSPQGDFLYVANAADNSISQFSINPQTGALTANTPATIATGTTPFAMALSSDDSSFYIPMGDSIAPGIMHQYSIAQNTGNLSPLNPATVSTGNKPWFATITPDDQFVYLTIFNSFGDPNPDTIEMFSRSPTTGALTSLSPASIATGDKPWHINVHPGGDYVYNVNNGDATVTGYQINSSTGQLTELTSSPFAVGNAPIGLSIDPLGRFLYVSNNGGNSVSMFSVNSTDGSLTGIGAGTIATNSPYGLEVDNSGRFLYVANSQSNSISMYSIDQVTGNLTPLSPASVNAGSRPRFIRISH